MFKFTKALFEKNCNCSIMGSTYILSYQLDSDLLYTSFVITNLFNIFKIGVIAALHVKRMSSSSNREVLVCLRTGFGTLKQIHLLFQQ